MRPRLLLPLLLVVAASGCTVVSPNPGQKAVLIDKPWLFGHNGVFGASCAQQGLIRLVDRA